MRAIYQTRVDDWRMSASALTSFIDIVYAGPMEFFKSYILRAPHEPESEALVFGDLIHKTFERVTNSHFNLDRAIEFFLAELEKKDLPVEILQKIREKGPADLEIALRNFGDILKVGKAEVDFASEKLSIDGIPVTGKIDHMVVDEENKTIEIYDFKTGGYHKEKWQSHATLYKYMLQLGFYKLILNNSAAYSKYTVKKAHILFVIPDNDGEVYDKVYDFNPDEERILLDLMHAVYNQVSTLEFLDDEDVFVPADNSLGVKDIKNFVSLLLAK